MKTGVKKYWNWGVSVLVGIGIFLFWYCWYPHALSYQEQYQLFLWTGDYFLERVSVPGGLADWLGEFVVQFYYVEWLGALMLAGVFVLLQRLCVGKRFYLLSFVLPLIVLWLMGDPSVLLSVPVGFIITLAAFRALQTRSSTSRRTASPLTNF